MRQPVTKAWIDQVRFAMFKQGYNQRALAEEIGVSGSYISAMLGGKVESSNEVETISELLDIDPPLVLERDAETRAAREIIAALARGEDPVELRQLAKRYLHQYPR